MDQKCRFWVQIQTLRFLGNGLLNNKLGGGGNGSCPGMTVPGLAHGLAIAVSTLQVLAHKISQVTDGAGSRSLET